MPTQLYFEESDTVESPTTSISLILSPFLSRRCLSATVILSSSMHLNNASDTCTEKIVKLFVISQCIDLYVSRCDYLKCACSVYRSTLMKCYEQIFLVCNLRRSNCLLICCWPTILLFNLFYLILSYFCFLSSFKHL